MNNKPHWKKWTLEQFAKHYAETLAKAPNGWGQHTSPIFGQSHHIMICARKIFKEDEVNEAFSSAIKEASHDAARD